MARTARKRSESDVYHVMVRGEGRHILFEDDEDRLSDRLSDADALAIAKKLLGENQLSTLGSRAKRERDEGVARLRRAGLSVRQIERFTGISRGIVSRAK